MISITLIINTCFAPWSDITLAPLENLLVDDASFAFRYKKNDKSHTTQSTLLFHLLGFSITENCVYLKVAWDWIIPAKRLFPVGELKCGSRRKRSALEKALEADVYTKELEVHKRVRRQATEGVPCSWNLEGEPKTGLLTRCYWRGFFLKLAT